MDVLVTVGMGPWPFDRLIAALDPLCEEHTVYAQIGTSTQTPPCEHVRFLPYDDLMSRIAAADVVITHAGNTVRIVQRLGKLPIAVARTADLAEMANDHQVEYLCDEELHGRAVAAWDVTKLPELVREHPRAQAACAGNFDLPSRTDPAALADRMDALWNGVTANPFARDPLRRYAYAWEELAGLHGPHLDVGCGSGQFLATLARTTDRPCTGVDVHPGYVQEARAAHPELEIRHQGRGEPLPFADDLFTSVSLLDVLEHCADEDYLLAEIRRVLRPDGRLVLTVPGQHIFSILDPDNAKFRLPRVHRAVYTRRFGADVYHERFVDISDGLRGDLAVERDEHTNYCREALLSRLTDAGFEVEREDGANLFWRLLHGPSLLAGPRLRAAFDRAILFDGRRFSRANIFVTARVTGEGAPA